MMISIAFEGTTRSSERTYLVARNQDKPSAIYYLGVICRMNSGGYAGECRQSAWIAWSYCFGGAGALDSNENYNLILCGPQVDG